MFELSGLNRQLAIYGLGGVLNRAIGFLLIPLYTNYLTVAEYGTLAILGVLFQLVSLVGLIGISTASIRYYHESHADIAYRKRLYGNAAIILVVWPVILFLALSLGAARFSNHDIAGIDFFPLVFLVLLIGVFSPLTKLLIGLLRAQGRSTAYVLYNLTFFVFQSFLIIYLVAFREQGIIGQVVGQTIANVVMFVLAAILLIRYCTFSFDKILMSQLLKFGISLLPFFIFAWINTSAGRFVLQHYLDLESVGIFFLAAQFAGIVGLANTSLNNAYTPHFYREARSENADVALGELILKFTAFFAFLSLVVVTISPHIISLIAPAQYLSAVDYVAPLTLATFLFCLSSPVNWSLTYSKQGMLLSKIRIVNTVGYLVILMGLVWADLISIQSVIVGMVIVNSIMLVMGWRAAQKHFVIVIDRSALTLLLALSIFLGYLLIQINETFSWKLSAPLSILVLLVSALMGKKISGATTEL